METIMEEKSNNSSDGEQPSSSPVLLPLDQSIIQSKCCVNMIVDNRFLEAIEMSARLASVSLYHSHCYSMLLYFKVYLSLELPEMKQAQEASNKTLRLCDSIRTQTLRDNFLVKLFFNQDYENFTDEELHSELIRAEQTLFSTMVEFMLDQSIFALMRAGYRVRSSYSIYKSFLKLINTREWSNEVVGTSFETGVKLGMGFYNLMFSMVPERLMGYISLVGFKGNKYEGLRLLAEAGSSGDIRSFVAQMLLSFYECYLDQIWNVHSVKTLNTERFIQNGLKTNSLSIWYLVFKGRCSLIEHDLEQAIRDFEGCVLDVGKHLDVKQLFTLYVWELMWCYALAGNWDKAIKYSQEMRNICVWSVSTLYYLEGSFRLMAEERKILADKKYRNSKAHAKAKDRIHELLSQVPLLVKRYAGRRIPWEKYVCEKVNRYLNDGQLVAPVYELLVAWNSMIFIEGNEKYIKPILDHVDQCLEKFGPDLNDFSYFRLMLVKGCFNRLLARYPEAEESLLEVIENKSSINTKHEKHLYSFAALELGIVTMKQGRYEESEQWLRDAKADIKENASELVIHFRVHKAIRLMRRMKEEEEEEEKKKQNSDTESN